MRFILHSFAGNSPIAAWRCEPTIFIYIPFLLNDIMSKQNKVNLPSGMGGLTRYFDDYTSNIELKPGHVVILCIIIMVLVIFLHLQGGSLLGLG